MATASRLTQPDTWKSQFDRAIRLFEKFFGDIRKDLEGASEATVLSHKEAHRRRREVIDKFADLFDSPANTACSNCSGIGGRSSCCHTYMTYGHFASGDFSPETLSGEVNLLELVVLPSEKEQLQPSEDRCIFLSPTGCNIPRHHRSTICTIYTCGTLEEQVGARPSDLCSQLLEAKNAASEAVYTARSESQSKTQQQRGPVRAVALTVVG